MKRIPLQFILFILSSPLIWMTDPAAAQTNRWLVSWKVPYYNSAPVIIDRTEKAIESLDNYPEIRAWAQSTAQRFPEFLDDMIRVCAQLEQAPFPYDDITPVIQFDQKWMSILRTCPDCDKIFPLLRPIIQDMLSAFPVPPEPKPGELSTDYTYRLFQFLTDVNPWGLGAVFYLSPIPQTEKILKVHEVSKETRTRGIKKTFVYYRRVLLKENTRVKFKETIINDKVVEEGNEQGPVTILHEVAEALSRDQGDPDVLKALRDLTVYVDELLRTSWENGRTDDFSYYYLYNQVPIRNEMVYVTHPLFLRSDQYKDYKVQEFYPRTFINGVYAGFGWEEYADPSAKVPHLVGTVAKNWASSIGTSSDATRRMEISRWKTVGQALPDIRTAPPVTPPAISNDSLPPLVSDTYITGINRISNLWSSGFFIPFYLFGVLGITKLMAL